MKLTESTWSPFQSAEVREICAHLTPEEHARLRGDARWRGQQIGQRLAVPSGVVAGSFGWSWQLGIVLLALFIVYFAVSGLLLLSLFYEVHLVRRFGGTPGKRLMGLRIMTIDGNPVGYRHALLRHAPLLLVSQAVSIGMILASLQISDSQYHALTWRDWSERLMALGPSWLQPVQHVQTAWMWSEFLVLLTNRKKRALHDFIAGTVVIDESSNAPLQPATVRAAAERPGR